MKVNDNIGPISFEPQGRSAIGKSDNPIENQRSIEMKAPTKTSNEELSEIQSQGGRVAQDIGSKVSVGSKLGKFFRAFMFTKSDTVRKQHTVAAEITTQKNLKNALAVEVGQLKKGEASDFKHLQAVVHKVTEQMPSVISQINKKGYADVKIGEHSFHVIKSKDEFGNSNFYICLGNAGGRLGTGSSMVKDVELGIKFGILGKDFQAVAIARTKEPSKAQEMKAEHKRSNELSKVCGDGIINSKEIVNLRNGKKAYISPYKPSDYAVNDKGIGEVQTQLKVNQKLENARSLLTTLKKMHEAGFTHNDIKGDNIRIDQNGKAGLIDFGEVVNREEHAKLRSEVASPKFQKALEKINKEIEEAGLAKKDYALQNKKKFKEIVRDFGQGKTGDEITKLLEEKDPEYKRLNDRVGELRQQSKSLTRKIDIAETNFDGLLESDMFNMCQSILDSFSNDEKSSNRGLLNELFSEFTISKQTENKDGNEVQTESKVQIVETKQKMGDKTQVSYYAKRVKNQIE